LVNTAEAGFSSDVLPGSTSSAVLPSEGCDMTTETDTTEPAGTTDAAVAVDADSAPTYVLTVSPEALERVLEIRDGEEDPGSLCLRVAITGASGTDYTYDLAFEEISKLEENDDLSLQSGLSIVVAADSIEDMRGATLDIPRAAGQGGLVIRNPNKPNPLVGRNIELTGDIADKVRQLLAEAINPSLASHGGFADLVGVEDTSVFITMGGGCQGCSMSAATLREGIQVAIKEAIPEVTDVVDVTDHEAGDNPFYS
jgi:Fe/S biogenesis protein NfuA